MANIRDNQDGTYDSRMSIEQIRAASIADGSAENVAITVGTSAFVLNASAATTYVKIINNGLAADDAANPIVLVAVNETPTFGSGTTGAVTWGVGFPYEVGSEMAPIEVPAGQTVRLLSDTALTLVTVGRVFKAS